MYPYNNINLDCDYNITLLDDNTIKLKEPAPENVRSKPQILADLDIQKNNLIQQKKSIDAQIVKLDALVVKINNATEE